MQQRPLTTQVTLVERFVAGVDRRRLEEIAAGDASSVPGLTFLGAIAIPTDETYLSVFTGPDDGRLARDPRSDRVVDAIVVGPWLRGTGAHLRPHERKHP